MQAVLTLSSVLENLLRRCSENPKSKGNSSFQLLRLLKLYGLATEPQLNILTSLWPRQSIRRQLLILRVFWEIM